MKSVLFVVLHLSLCGAFLNHAPAATIVKDNNADALSSGTSWLNDPVLGDVTPGPGDIAAFDGTITAPLPVQLGGDLSWQGIQITNVGGSRNAATTNVDLASTGSANTLTVGAAGIDMSGALQALRIESRISLAANQTWNIADANTAVNPSGLNKGEDLCFFALAPATPMNLGGFTVEKTGTGVAAIATGYTISNGTFNVDAGVLQVQSGGSRTTTINADVVMNVNTGASLRIAAESGTAGVGIQSSGAINLGAGATMTLQPNQATTITLAGNIRVAGSATLNVTGGSTSAVILSGNLIGPGDIAYANTATNNRLIMAGDNSAYSGTITLGGASGSRALRLASATAGSGAANWVVSAGNTLEIDGVAVSLGTLNGAGTVTNSSTANAAVSIGSGLFTGLLDNGAGSMGLTKVGPGTLELTAPNTYNGGSSVQGGTLLINAAQNGGGPVSVAGGATLAIRYATPTTFNSSTFMFGSGTGGTLSIDLGTLPNPATPVVAAPAFTVNGTNTIVLSGSGLTTGTFKLIDYTGQIGGAGFSGLTFTTPIPRIIASLVNNTTDQSVDLQISGLDKPKWTGANGNAWDIDNGTGTGTANWKEVASGNVTRYRETASGNDSVLFDDSGPGGMVNLTTTLSPSGVAVNTATRTYTFTGTGKLSGPGGLLKQGAAEFYLANTGANDYTGTTTISGGSLLLGNGGAGEGQLGTGALVDNAAFILNRSDDFVIGNDISGSGQIAKRGAGMATLAGTIALTGLTTIQTGAIELSGFANLPGGVSVTNNSTLVLSGLTPMTGVISGNGSVIAQGAGTKQISGTTANTYTGGTSIMQGLLQLNKSPGVDAVGGDIVIEGTGQLQLLAADQIPDTATITYNSGGANTVLGNETIANVTIIGGSENSQFNANNGLVITNLLTMSTGVFSVASNHSATIAGVNISGGTLRIAANTNPSTLNIGAGGITASGGLIQVGQGIGTFDAVLNLEGNYTGSGFVEFARGNYFGPNLREINLGESTRTFNVVSDFTTVRPDITGTGGLIKAGDGTLVLTGTNTFFGDTIIQGGTLSLSGTLSGSANIDVKSGAIFDVTSAVPVFTLAANQTLKGAGTVTGAVTAAGKLSPGESIGTLNFAGDLTLQGTADFEINKSGITLTADHATITGLLAYGGALNVIASGNSLAFGDTFDLFDASSFSGQFTTFNLPTLGSGLSWNTSRLPIDGTLIVTPEPTALALLSCALGGILTRRRRHS